MQQWPCFGLYVTVFKKAAASTLLLLSFFISCNIYSQSYYYFESKFNFADKPALNYFIFLTVSPDGTATAKILYKYPGTDEDRLVEQHLVDSSDRSSAVANDEKKYLTPYGDPVYKDMNDDGSFIQPRFVFKKQVDSTGTFYEPAGIEYSKTGEGWAAAEVSVNQQKSYDELTRQQDFVSLFFSPGESFYSFLFNVEARGGGLSSSEKKSRLFLIAVANTNDPKIGITSAKDLDKITETFTTLAEKLGIIVLQKTIAGTGFNKKAVDVAIDRWLAPAATDIVVFYYSGHGFRYSDDVSKYPRMSLRQNKDLDIDLNNLSVEAVYNRILKKKARVNIILSDCCNSDIGSNAPVGANLLRGRSTGKANLNLNIDNCRALFFPNHPLSILSTAAEVTQLAAGNPELGGFFTNFFQANLVKSLYSSEPATSWLKILIDAQESTRRQALTAMCDDFRCVQRSVLSVVPPQ